VDSGTLYDVRDEISPEVGTLWRNLSPHSSWMETVVAVRLDKDVSLLSEHEELPEDMTHAVFALTNPPIQPAEIAATVRIADSIGQPIEQVLIPWGNLPRYLKTGEL